MDIRALEVVVREVSYMALLITGCAVLIGISCLTVRWALLKFVSVLKLEVAFVAFLRSRK
jgi:hypothetical protein